SLSPTLSHSLPPPLPPPPTSPLFPYTTLFRSKIRAGAVRRSRSAQIRKVILAQLTPGMETNFVQHPREIHHSTGCWTKFVSMPRSEEHTSELQSRRDLVCRLLLEKKKKTK